jgi:hypothetical protein
MPKDRPIPPSYSLIKKGKTSLLIKDDYKDFLLKEGIEDIEAFADKFRGTSHYLKGRTSHPSVPLENGAWMVIRRYSHGGLLRALTGDLYLFGSRSFEELALTEEVRSCSIPTVQPIGAIQQDVFPPFYRSYFLSLEVPQARDLIRYFEEVGPHPSRETLCHKRNVIRTAGLLLQGFHKAGFFHGDLQLKNILVVDREVYLIDFDRSCRKQALTIGDRMKNLLRLNRSVEKWRRLGLPVTRTDRWRFFLAYAGGDEKIRQAMKKALRTYSVRHLFYRCCWVLGKIVGGSKLITLYSDLTEELLEGLDKGPLMGEKEMVSPRDDA